MQPLVGVALYMMVQFGIGIWVSRRIRTESDYIIAGRRLGYGLATFSIFATWFGAETIMGSAGLAYRQGVSLGSAEPFGYGLCLVLMGLVFAVPLWKRQLTTLADLFRQRFSIGTERLAAAILIPSSILWAAAQIRAFGYVLGSTSAMDATTATAIAAGFTILYSVFGGMLVDAITDMLQGIIVIAGLVILLVPLLMQGASDAAPVTVIADRMQLVPEGEGPLALVESWAIPIAGSVIATELVGRALAARSPTVAQRSFLFAGAMYVAIGAIPLVIGVLGPAVMPALTDPEQLIPELARTRLHPVLYAVFAGALLSAILSTVDSTLLTSSALLSHNIVVPLLRVNDERAKVRLARGAVAVFGFIAWMLATGAEGVFSLVQQASAFGSAGALVITVFGLFTRIGGPAAAIATLLTGLAAYLAGSYLDLTAPYLLSLGIALATYLAVSAGEGKSVNATLPSR